MSSHPLFYPDPFVGIFTCLLSALCVYVVVKFHIMKGPTANAPEN